ncbi:CBS domain-containing protein [Leifsonia sp. YIM 134122]|uniref:CBS domain-containing protein n=1 Tax=Leifsonia stereocauli TaxID=3134136 RepID=A0ABU9W1U3_9MICO
MPTARDIMSADPTHIGEDETLAEAARLMAELDVGALPIWGADDQLKGMLTDRDIVVKCIARGGDPTQVTAGELADGMPVTVRADEDIRDALTTMQDHQVRRLPVMDGRELVGMISQADIALSLSATETAETVEAISE